MRRSSRPREPAGSKQRLARIAPLKVAPSESGRLGAVIRMQATSFGAHRLIRVARIKPTPRLNTPPARKTTPTYARFIRRFGSVAVGDATERKNAAGMRIAAIGAPTRASHFQKGGNSV